MKEGVWNNNVPVELSPYLQDDDVSFFNIESCKFDSNKPKMIDLFCGAGGFSVGCSWAGFETVFGIDHFKPAMETWVANHPNAIGCLGDIRKINEADIHKRLKKKGINKITLLTGGVPCQGFTIANRKHNDADERNFLYLEYMKFVKEFQPDYIILENVGGMRSTAGGQFENAILTSMQNLGYSAKVKLLNAASFGVPQIRQRLIFVGVRSTLSYNEYEFPQPIYYEDNYTTVEDAFSDLPLLRPGETCRSYKQPPQNTYQKYVRGVNSSINSDESVELLNHTAPNHPQSTVELIGNAKPGEPMYNTFKQRIRLSLNKPSPTQLAGGIRPSFQFGHPVDARGLSTRERARIQSFPDTYIFKGGIVQERVQTGNAIPPLLSYYVAKQIFLLYSKENRLTLD